MFSLLCTVLVLPLSIPSFFFFFSPDLRITFPRCDKPKNTSFSLKVIFDVFPLWISVSRHCYPVCCSVRLKCWDFTCWATPNLCFLAGAPFGDAAHGGPALSLRWTALIKCNCFLQKDPSKHPEIHKRSQEFPAFLSRSFPESCSSLWAGGIAQSQA